MALPQTSYSDRLRPAVAGMIANSRPKDTISRIVAPAGGLAFGVPAFQGAAANQVTSTFALDGFVGITIRDVTLARTIADATSIDKYKQGENCGVLREGVIWVQASVAVDPNDPIYITPASAFTNVANSGANAGPFGRWDSATAGAGLARAELVKK